MIKKILFKITCVCGIAMGAMSYMASTQGKDPFWYLQGMSPTMPDIAIPEMPELPKLEFKQAKAEKTTIYQWTDEQGRKQFSSSPPAHHDEFTTLQIDPNANLMKAHPIPEPEAEDEPHQPIKPDVATSTELPSYKDVGKIQQQLDQIKAINANRVDSINQALSQQ